MRFRGVAWRLLLIFLIVSPLPLAGLAYVYVQEFEQVLAEKTLSNLSSVADKKEDQITSYLRERVVDVEEAALSARTRDALAGLSQGHALPGETAESFRAWVEKRGYWDLLLIDREGNVVFSVAREPDLGTNLNTGPYRATELANGYRWAMQLMDTQITEFRPYAPSANRPATFLVAPVLRDGRLVGAVALQLDLERFIQVATDPTGLGNSGETVLSQRVDGDVLYNVPLRHIPDAAFKYRVPFAKVAPPMQQALSGQRGQGITQDYQGAEVVAAWRYLPALHWGMVVKTDTREAFAPARRLRLFSLLSLLTLLLVSAGTALLSGRAIVAPMRRLMDASEKISAGDLTYRAVVSGWEESQRLAKAFNHMADRLVDAQVNLERRVSERTEELQRSNEHFDRIARTVPGVLYDYVVAPEGGKFLYVSPKCRDILGVEPEALLRDADEFWKRLHAADRKRLRADEADAHRAGGPLCAEVRLVMPSGREKWIEINSLPGGGRFGEEAVRSGIILDVTSRKEAEIALEHLNATLELRIEQAVNENRQKELLLIQQSRLAAMGEMIHNIAHQWRQPLSALNLLVYNLRDAYEFHELDQQFLDSVVAKATSLTQRMSSTIDDFRNFFKPNKEMAYFSISRCIDEVWGILGAGLKNHGINWVCEVDKNIEAFGYGNEFSQVLLNVINNAKEAIVDSHVPAGRITISAAVTGGRVVVTVTDNGGGIPADVLPKIFDPYFTTKEKGSGIGLYMSKMIVEGHMGGQLSARNVEGGAEFVIAVPRAPAEVA